MRIDPPGIVKIVYCIADRSAWYCKDCILYEDPPGIVKIVYCMHMHTCELNIIIIIANSHKL